MEVVIDTKCSIVKIEGLFKLDIEVHLTKIPVLKKRLESNDEFPFKRIFDVVTPLDNYNIKNLGNRREELLEKLQCISKVK